MIEPQTGFALIALTRKGRGGDAGWPARDNHEFEGIWPAKCTARGVSEFSQLLSGCRHAVLSCSDSDSFFYRYNKHFPVPNFPGSRSVADYLDGFSHELVLNDDLEFTLGMKSRVYSVPR
jgi:hypothetical protein